MSRSYKHTPYCGIPKSKFHKNQANRKLRRQKLTHNFDHKSYRKDYCSWDICDYYHIETKNFHEYYAECIHRWYVMNHQEYWRKIPFPTREECWKEYNKYYIRK